jgi:anaerobic dimethyl sulfoxide reductase subunit B (iron-sulfur subunit)
MLMMSKQYGFYINTDRCVQCHACEVACKAWNSVELGIKWRRVADFWEGSFPEVTNQTVSYSCMHCEKPACVQVCPSGALSKRVQDGIVIVDQSKCIACRSCAEACPFDVPQYGKSGIMQKCNMCLERIEQNKQPQCVETCPGEALKFGTMEELMELSAARSGSRLSAKTVPCFIISGKLTGAKFLTLFDL